MHCVLPPSLQDLLELAEHPRADDNFTIRFIDAFLKGLAVLGTAGHIVTDVRKHLELVGAVTQQASDGVMGLEAILRRHDLLFSPEMSGFGNLFRTMIDEGDVFCGVSLEFDGLEPNLRNHLTPLGRASKELQAAEDVAVAADAPMGRVFACICLSSITDWMPQCAITDFLGQRLDLKATRHLFAFRSQLDVLTPHFIQSDLAQVDLRDFALWFLAHRLCQNIEVDLMQRRLIDTLMRKSGLPNYAVFERAFASLR
jgi:hypothetical protein